MAEPLCFQLHFDGGASWEALREAASSVVEAVGAPPGEWTCGERVELADRSFGDNAFRARWTRSGNVELVEEATSGSGNPRDGYGYDNSWRLEMEGLVVELDSSAWEPHPRELMLTVRAGTAETLENVRGALRASLGKRRDRSAEPYAAAQNVRAAREQDPERARAWLEEALRRGRPRRDFGGWHQLLLEQEALQGPSEDNLMRRMRDVPGDVAAWRRAHDAPPRGWTRERVARVLERVAPWKRGALVPPWNEHVDDDRTQWFEMDDGLGATTASRARLDVPLLREMAPDLLQAPALGFDAVREGNRTASSRVQAMWPSRSRRGVVFARVTRSAQRYGRSWSKRSPLERLRAQPHHVVEHHWLWLRKARVCVQLVSETLRLDGRKVHLGHALGVTPGFVDEVMDALRTFCPFRWRPADPDALFIEREPRQLYVRDDGEPTAAELRTVLRRAGAATPEVLELLKRCRCEPEGGYCEHDRALIDVKRRFEREVSEADGPRERFLATARVAALRAASAHRRTRRVDRYPLLQAVRDLARAEACA